jgi:hypothetical protein
MQFAQRMAIALEKPRFCANVFTEIVSHLTIQFCIHIVSMQFALIPQSAQRKFQFHTFVFVSMQFA